MVCISRHRLYEVLCLSPLATEATSQSKILRLAV